MAHLRFSVSSEGKKETNIVNLSSPPRYPSHRAPILTIEFINPYGVALQPNCNAFLPMQTDIEAIFLGF